MLLAVLSDIHDNLWNLAPALAGMQQADVLLCCGDLCSPFVIPQLAGLHKPVHIVFGNNDADLFRITQNAARHAHVQLHGEMLQLELDGCRLAMNHFDYLARPIAQSGQFDLVCFGHNHHREATQYEKTLALNPGPIMGAHFDGGVWTDCEPTFALYDTRARSARFFVISADKKTASAFD